MRYVFALLLALTLASPAFAGSGHHNHHSPPSPETAAKADAAVVSIQASIIKMQAAGNPNPKVLDHLQNGVLPAAEARAAAIHEQCGC